MNVSFSNLLSVFLLTSWKKSLHVCIIQLRQAASIFLLIFASIGQVRLFGHCGGGGNGSHVLSTIGIPVPSAFGIGNLLGPFCFAHQKSAIEPNITNKMSHFLYMARGEKIIKMFRY